MRFRSSLLSIVLVFGQAAVASSRASEGIRISCRGSASVSLNDGVVMQDTLNPRLEPFETRLDDGQRLYVGAAYGGCGYCGISGVFRAHFELINRAGLISLERIETGDERALSLGRNTIKVARLGRTLVLECEIKEMEPRSRLTRPSECCYDGSCRFNCE